ncbi:hypothetical protein ACRAWD_09590 [Caulobacter segnis]
MTTPADRKRLGIATAFQWKPSDDLLITAQYQRTKYWFNRTGAYYYDYNNRSNVRNAAGMVTSYGTDPLPGAAFSFNSEGYATKGSLQNQSLRDRPLRPAAVEPEPELHPERRLAGQRQAEANFDAQYLKSYYNADRNGHVLSLYTQSGRTGADHAAQDDRRL